MAIEPGKPGCYYQVGHVNNVYRWQNDWAFLTFGLKEYGHNN